MAELFWVSSRTDVATVANEAAANSSREKQVVKAVSAGTTVISVWKNEADYKKNGSNYYSNSALKTWTVTVTEWKVTLSFSGSSSDSSESSEDDDARNDQSTIATNQRLFDVNLMNPQTLDDYAGMDGVIRKSQAESVVMAISDPTQSTPEFIINVLKQTFADNVRHCSLQMYQTIMQLLTTMHFVKLNDKSQRAQNTVTLLIPHIQTMQRNVERLILGFMKRISRTAGTSLPLQDPALFQMTCHIRFIEQQIKKLNHARAIVLKREFLSENHVRQLHAELYRAMQMTYGYPKVMQTDSVSEKQWLQVICHTYAGADKRF